MNVITENTPANKPQKWRVLVPLIKTRTALIGVALFAAVLGLQRLSGAFTAEFSGYPDEASHYISGLLLHDYVKAGFPAGPMRFAQDFYLHYPYLAIGHWPPLFYILEGAWMLLFSPSRISVMLLMAGITTALALSLYQTLRTQFGEFSALMAGLLLICVPVVQNYTSMVMLDTPLALLSFWAVVYYGRFLGSGDWRDSLKFGVISLLAVLTKGNAFDLALVPPLALLLTRRFYLLRRPAFWLPVPILSLGLPWHLFTLHLMLPTFGDAFGLSFTERALRFYGLLLMKSLGPAVIGLVLIGLYSYVIRPFVRRQVGTQWAAAAAFLLSALAFYAITPAGIEARYVIPAIPFLLMFLVAGAYFLSSMRNIPSLPRQWRFRLLILVTVLIFAGFSFRIPKRISYGFDEAVNKLVTMPQFSNSLVLVSSQTPVGEGIFVSEVAMKGHREAHAVLRATKVLADDDWNATHYRARYPTPQVLMDCLDQTPIRFIVLDTSPAHMSYQHHRELQEIVTNHRNLWKLVGVFQGDEGGSVYVYMSTNPRLEQTSLGVSLKTVITNMNGSLEHWPISMRLSCGTVASTATLAEAHAESNIQ